MRKRVIRVSAVGVAGLLALSACSGGSSGGGSDEEITIWHMESSPNRVEAWQALAEEYNATDPERPVKVQVQEWDAVYQGIAAAAQSNTQPDVLFTIPDFTTYVRNLGLGQPVTDLVSSLDEEYGFIDAATAPYTDEDEVWAVPLYGMVQMLWYRQDQFAEHGLEAPETWSELRDAAETLTGDGTSGIALPAGQNLASDQVIYSLMVTGGAADIFTEDGAVDFDKPEVVDALEFYNELLQYSPEDSASYSWGEPQAAFNSGSAAMTIEKGQYLAPWEAESGLTPDQLGCAPIPVKDDGGEPGSIYYSNGAMVLTEDAERQEAAGAFLEWIMQPDVYGSFLEAEPGLFLPVTTDEEQVSTWREGDVVSTYSDCVDAMLEQSETGELFGFVDGQYIDSVGDISGQNIIAQAIQQMYVNGMSATEAAAWAQTAMEEAIS